MRCKSLGNSLKPLICIACFATFTPILKAQDGVRNATVVVGGSPFAAGNQSVLLVDTTGTNSGSALSMSQTSPALPIGSGAVFAVDFRLNADGTQNNVWLQPSAGSFAGCSVHLVGNALSGTLSAKVGGVDQFLCALAVDRWYRLQVAMQRPNLGNQSASLYVTPWLSGGNGTATRYIVDGFSSASDTGFNQVAISTVNPGDSTSVNVDNITLVSNDPLLNAPEISWKSQYFTAAELANPAISGDLADPDGDGISNLMEYALNLNPKQADAIGQTTSATSVVSGTTCLDLVHRKNTTATDITFTYEQSTDLVTWTPATPELISTVSIDSITNALTMRVPAVNVPPAVRQLFLRLKVTRL